MTTNSTEEMIKLLITQEALAAYTLIFHYFNRDINKSMLWFKSVNPLLGNITPLEMIRNGRVKKLLDFIESSLEDNHP